MTTTKDVKFSAGATSVHIADSGEVANLNKALHDPDQFKQFQADPKGFVAKHGVTIDASAAEAIKHAVASATTVGGITSPGGKVAATVAAVADGAFAAASSKIAVAAFGGFVGGEE